MASRPEAIRRLVEMSLKPLRGSDGANLKNACLTVALGTAVTVGPARAEQSADDLLRRYSVANPSERQAIEQTIAATENGMGWFSTVAKVTIYCEPKNISLTGSQIIDILRRRVAQTPRLGTHPYGYAMFRH